MAPNFNIAGFLQQSFSAHPDNEALVAESEGLRRSLFVRLDSAVTTESCNRPIEFLDLLDQRVDSRGRLLGHRRVLLSHPVHVVDSAVHLSD